MGTVDLHIGQAATLACLLEAIAPKPGNVHRGADFDDLSFTDLAVSAVAIAPVMEKAWQESLGATVLNAVQATARHIGSNANLGIILLFAPLAAVPKTKPLRQGVKDGLSRITTDDAALVYEAIRLARPGGLGTVDKMDVAGGAPSNLLEAMNEARERDMIARQYMNGFCEVFDYVVPWLVEGQNAGWPLTQSIIRTHVRFMAEFPDSLIARKCGSEVAAQSQTRARQTLDAGLPNDENYEQALAELDFWLRSDGHRRNPGTTADLIAAGLFVAIRDGRIPPPWH